MAVVIVLCGLTVGATGCSSDSDDPTPPPPPPPPPPFAGNVLLDSILPDMNYTFAHNSTSSDRKKMLVTMNKAASPYTGATGVTDLYLLDAEKMAQGEVAALPRAAGWPASIGSNANTPANVAFRSAWTADDLKIVVAGKDRLWVLGASDLAPLNGPDGDAGLLAGSAGTYYENHDALPTTDGKYAILTLRTKPHADPDATKMDGEIKLYDLSANQVVGAGVSVCNSCHGTPKHSVLCGLDGKVEKQADGTYAGTVYLPGHGGHIAKVPLTIDPANTASPITVGAIDRITISMSKFPAGHASAGQSQFKMHDVRIDGNTMYWSTINTDATGKAHYGKVDLTTLDVTTHAIDVDAAATMPSVPAAGDRGNIYCGSGQSATAYMPVTMTHKAYVTVIPKF